MYDSLSITLKQAAPQRYSSDFALSVIACDNGLSPRLPDVAEIGCGAGTQTIIWAETGHRVYELDVSKQSGVAGTAKRLM